MRPSRQVLDALARALRLAPAERAHLHELVHGVPPTATAAAAETLRPGVGALVDRLDPHPTYVTGRRFDVLAANRAARLRWTDWAARAPDERNLLWFMLTDPQARVTFVEWERGASALLARYRSAADRYPDEAAFADLTGRLHVASPEVRAWWPRHDIAPLSSGTKRLRHPLIGELELTDVVLQVADDPEQKLVTFAAGARDRARIAGPLCGL